ncbi:hypothetical protein FNL39_12114 [Nocardia caishijiensis]|uniref:Uncharacterized protein n=1 Tax=Nocardia caishijiensis TaxID=184756 RepID=A0ABQ6YEV2_9NOCA|nr:hypothetical protein FNL39_12114 [Nocardia caishijiensis]
MTHRRGAKKHRSNDSSALAARLPDEYRSAQGSLGEWFDSVSAWIVAEGGQQTQTTEVLEMAEVDPRAVISGWLNAE